MYIYIYRLQLRHAMLKLYTGLYIQSVKIMECGQERENNSDTAMEDRVNAVQYTRKHNQCNEETYNQSLSCSTVKQI